VSFQKFSFIFWGCWFVGLIWFLKERDFKLWTFLRASKMYGRQFKHVKECEKIICTNLKVLRNTRSTWTLLENWNTPIWDSFSKFLLSNWSTHGRLQEYYIRYEWTLFSLVSKLLLCIWDNDWLMYWHHIIGYDKN